MIKCYEIDKQLNDNEAMSSTLNNLAVAYKNWGYRETAIEYYRQSLAEHHLPGSRLINSFLPRHQRVIDRTAIFCRIIHLPDGMMPIGMSESAAEEIPSANPRHLSLNHAPSPG